MRLQAAIKRRTVLALRRKLARAEAAYQTALEQDAAERAARAARRRAYQAEREQAKRERIIRRAARQRKAPWHERVRVRLLYPTIGGET